MAVSIPARTSGSPSTTSTVPPRRATSSADSANRVNCAASRGGMGWVARQRIQNTEPWPGRERTPMGARAARQAPAYRQAQAQALGAVAFRIFQLDVFLENHFARVFGNAGCRYPTPPPASDRHAGGRKPARRRCGYSAGIADQVEQDALHDVRSLATQSRSGEPAGRPLCSATRARSRCTFQNRAEGNG
jgi:hypothetical protein